jgi:hypothetical protein
VGGVSVLSEQQFWACWGRRLSLIGKTVLVYVGPLPCCNLYCGYYFVTVATTDPMILHVCMMTAQRSLYIDEEVIVH